MRTRGLACKEFCAIGIYSLSSQMLHTSHIHGAFKWASVNLVKLYAELILWLYFSDESVCLVCNFELP